MQYQYTCQGCGNPRFVEVDEEGFKFYQELGISPKLTCPACMAHRDAPRQQRQEPQKVVDPVQRIIDRWVPPEYQDSDESLFPQSAWGASKFWIPGKKGILYYGPTQRCKSRMAYRILMKAIRLGLGGEAYDCRTFRAKVEESISAQKLWEWYRQLEKVPVLLFDDLGKFAGEGKRIEEEVFNVVKLRCEQQRGMIITTNDTPASLSKKFSDGIGGPLIARLCSFCAAVSVYTPEEEAALTQTPDLLQSASDL